MKYLKKTLFVCAMLAMAVICLSFVPLLLLPLVTEVG